MRVEGQNNGRRAITVRARSQLLDYGLVAAMYPVEHANGQPGVLQGNVGEGTVMLHEGES
jgi:hypothetical protein